MERNGLPFESQGIFLTNVVSHISMLFPVLQLIRRKWVLEACVGGFAVFTSFMYHLTQALQTTIFMEELQWHFLDNIGAISAFAVLFTYASCIRDAQTESWLKLIFVLFALVVQMPHPWDVQYTFGPIGLFSLMPVVSFLYKVIFFSPENSNKSTSFPPPQQQSSFLARAQHVFSTSYHVKEIAIGGGALCVALFFFSLGLDEKHDPYRVYHGMWHVCGGFSSLHLWRIVKDPIANDVVEAVERIQKEKGEKKLFGSSVSGGVVPVVVTSGEE